MEDVELFIVIGGVLTLLFIIFIVSFLLVNQKRHFHYLKEKQQLKNNFEQTLLQTQLEIQEQTLQHISRELHDNISQVASLIKINLHTFPLDNRDKAIAKLETTKDLMRQLITDLKMLSVSLNSDRISQSGLANALAAETEKINKTGAFAAFFEMCGSPPTLDNEKAIILYRMAQELINNILKHSAAKQIHILLAATEKFVTLAISDDGVGFDIEAKRTAGGAGLLNLENRARLINAKLTMHSTPGNGSAVNIELPLN